MRIFNISSIGVLILLAIAYAFVVQELHKQEEFVERLQKVNTLLLVQISDCVKD